MIYLISHNNNFQHSLLLSMGCSEGEPDSPSIMPVAQHFKNNSGLYRSYSHHKAHMGDLAPEQFLGTITREMMMIVITLKTIIYSFFQPSVSTLDDNRYNNPSFRS